ncbi:hypothetical protein CHX27_05070 [Flavobacterium aurantiibacter]|uniref:Peptidase C39-like domain-containing protein n=1 Tax=Flavobacterium aurantiibacter TaxID=2023067 RepID=A0A255ZYX3_9FLAO|nr:hypothetical protein CHX27_05070 [Flavobacterium aurantiibacter]
MTNKNESDNKGENLEDDNSGPIDTNEVPDFDINQSWPNIAPVIPVSAFVGWSRLHRDWECMEYSKEQLRVMGYKISSYHAVGQTFQVFTAQSGVNQTQVVAGVKYLKYALTNGIPVIVGVDNHAGSPNPQTDNTTDHFIVIVGMGQDAGGKYFRFYDNASGAASQGTSVNNKLYYNSDTGVIEGQSQTNYAVSNGYNPYRVTMIRKSKSL